MTIIAASTFHLTHNVLNIQCPPYVIAQMPTTLASSAEALSAVTRARVEGRQDREASVAYA